MPLAIQSTNTEKVPVTATPVTHSGAPAQVDGDLRFTITAGDATVEATIGSMSFFCVSGMPGTSTILVEADADLGEGVRLIQDVITYTVVGEEAEAFGFVAEAPVPK